jgi:uncharacterized RDD family membrane protein YckC
MTCAFCGSRNGEAEHRCRKCGRRPSDTLTGEVARHRTEGQLALKAEMHAVEAPGRRASAGRPYQTSLFQPASNIIPFESYAPVEPRPRQRAEGVPAKPRTSRKRVVEGQGQLDFLAPAPPKPRTLGTTVEAVIFCDAPVAVKLHRAVAAALDWSMVAIAYGLFLVVFYLMGGSIALNKPTVLTFMGVLFLLGFGYRLMWALAGAETMGMHWTQLKLLTFEGFPPDTRQRILRVLGSSLSVCTIIGVAWSLVDEEVLGWQDHISRTFPTPREAENLVLVRR